MKVLLLQNIRKVGQKGQIVDVSEGYGRNFLINRGLAKIATGDVLKKVETTSKIKAEQSKHKQEEELKKFAEVNKSTFTIKAKASEKGHLFAGIHKSEIAKEVDLKEEYILLDHDIKEIGTFDIKIQVADKKGKFALNVVAL